MLGWIAKLFGEGYY